MIEKIAVVGLGYVGLPVAVGMARAHGAWSASTSTAGRVAALRRGTMPPASLRPRSWPGSTCATAPIPRDLAGCTCFIVTVPTPIDADRQPDLGPLRRACADDRARPCGRAAWWCSRARCSRALTEEICGPLAGGGLRACAGPRLPRSATRPSGSIRATGRTGWRRITKVVAADSAASAGARRRRVYGPVVRGRAAPGAVDPGGRGRQGDREHPARPQHRADERAGADLRPARHPHRRRAGGSRRPSGTSCRSRRAWSAATASASTPTI